MKGTLLAVSVFATLLLSGCQTMNGADDAFMNLVGPSTQSRFSGRYMAQAEVAEHFKLSPQTLTNTRLSFDGRTIPADETRQKNLVKIPALQTYLQGIVNKLAKGWPGELPPLQVRIDDSQTFGPSADAFGNIFVPLGMLESVESEDEIAALLGHEMSHVLLRHHDRRAAFQQQKELMTNLATVVTLSAMASNTGVDRSSGKLKLINKDPLGTQKTIGNTVLYTALANSFSDNIWSTAWGRTQEDQADLLGADLMIRSGYAPRAASHSLQRLNDFQGKQEPLLESFLVARKGAMQDALTKLDLNRFSNELQVFVNQGLTTSITAAGQYFNRSHMSATDRDEELRQYLQREYRQERRAKVDRNSWQKVRNSTAVASSLKGYKSALESSLLLETGDTRGAQVLIDQALSSPVKNQPGIRRAAFSLHLAQGNSRKALGDLQAIDDWTLASPSLYEIMIDLHLKNGDGRAALAMIDKAERNFGSEELFITDKLIANQQLKDEAQVKDVLGKCVKYQSRRDTCKKLAPAKA